MSAGQLQRAVSIVIGAAVIVLVGWLTLEQTDRRIRPESDAGVDASAAPSVSAPPSAAVAPRDELPELADAGLFLPVLDTDGDAGALPNGAPRTVKLGVVLVQFAGAEGAPPNARSKKDARAEAEKLAPQARTDFHAAVRAGDPGSSEDIGRIPRGVLDPRTEVTVFSLHAGDVSEILETPRGYWIVKRIE